MPHFAGSSMARLTIVAICLLAIRQGPTTATISTTGRWLLTADGSPAPHDGLTRGLQTSGLAWYGEQLWSVGDQRSAFPGCLFVIDPQTARLTGPPIPLFAERDDIRSLLADWGRIDLEGIDSLSRDEPRFVVLVEDEDTAALVVRVNAPRTRATVEAIWQFRFPNDTPPEPFRGDSNYRLEGIAIDRNARDGFVAFERDRSNRPLLFRFELARAPATGIGPVQLEPVRLDCWEQIGGKQKTLLNVNGLEFTRTAAGARRLFVLCRDRELVFIVDLDSRQLVAQVEIDFRSPDGDRIEWASPEGIAIDRDGNRVFIVSDPDSTDGNWRLRSTPRAAGRFSEFVPLLFEFKLPAETDTNPKRKRGSEW